MEPASGSIDVPVALAGAILPDAAVCAPASWRAALLRQLDSSSRTAVAQTCKGALQGLLHDWPDTAILTIPAQSSTDQSPLDLLRSVQRVREQLALRGDRPVTIALVQKRGEQVSRDSGWWQTALGILGAGRAPSDHLTLSLQMSHVPQALITYADQAFSGLRSLSIGSQGGLNGDFTGQLPTPISLPSLRALTIHRHAPEGQAALWTSVGPYLPQLHSLTITAQPVTARNAATGRPMWVSVFSPANTTHTLTHLSLPCKLEQWLAERLGQHAPRLQLLAVAGVLADADAGAGADVDAADTESVGDSEVHMCTWHTLRLTGVDKGLRVEAWAWLPLPEGGRKLAVEMPGAGTLEFDLPLAAEVSHKLASVEIKGCTSVTLRAVADTDTQPAALQEALAALFPAIPQAPNPPTLTLRNFTMTDALAAELAAAVAACWSGRLSLLSCEWPTDTVLSTPLPPLHTLDLCQALDDPTLESLLTGVSTVHELSVTDVCVSGTVEPRLGGVPWERVRVYEARVVEWLAQTEILGWGTVEWALDHLFISLTADEVLELQPIVEPLSKLTMSVKTVYVDCPFAYVKREQGHVESSHLCTTDHACFLRASLTIAAALPCEPQRVHVRGFVANSDVVAAFRQLPAWSNTELRLDLKSVGRKAFVDYHWPLSRLPCFIPRTYKHISISEFELEPGELLAFMYGVPGDRTREQPLTVQVLGKEKHWVERVSSRIRYSGTFPYVTVR